MDNRGTVRDQCRLPNDAKADHVAQLPESTFAVLKVTGNQSYIYDVLANRIKEVVLTHPKRVKAIAAARINE